MPVAVYTQVNTYITNPASGISLNGDGLVQLPNSTTAVGASGTDSGPVGFSFINQTHDSLEFLRLQLRNMGIIR